MNIWVVKCSEHREEDDSSWHWRKYFEGLDDDSRTDWPYTFGGDSWVHHAASIRRIHEEIAPGDIIVCYQRNHRENDQFREDREILGLTLLESYGRADEDGSSGRFTVFTLIPADQAFVFSEPIQVERDLYTNGIHPKCFMPGTHGTLFPVAPGDFADMINFAAERLPLQRQALQTWLAQAGW